ncbi:amidase family protein [Salinisphaera sp. Q1T1-3]|uniref:amidase family protein n=1 Tax=Salinisphaera sp. Q1T1-3 TaxID=2321229 RepID=UPI001314F989|nr:amidase family protein [Salinisphaera sp. Q1T1-3]
MTDEHRTTQGALSQGQALAQSALDPAALVERCLTAATTRPTVFTQLTPERARREAEASARRHRAGYPVGPLDGVPIVCKDIFDMAGTSTTAGSRCRLDRVAERDAPAMRHASAAGLVCIGKTNLSELAYSGLGLNPHYGTPHHTPGDGPARAPGGSSSGTAVAIAQGLVTAGLGTDTAGSLRIPAAFNGLAAYRPTQARHSRDGVVPLARSTDTVGVIANDLSGCLAVDAAIAGETVPEDLGPATPDTAAPLILETGLLEDAHLAPAIRTHLLAACERLRAAGFSIIERRVTSIHDVLAAIRQYGWIGAAEAYTEHQALLASAQAGELDPRVARRLGEAATIRPEQIVTLYRLRRELARAHAAETAGAVVISPTVADVAPLLGPLEADDEHFAAVNREILRLTMVASFLDAPAVALPSGTDNAGQHTSLQLSSATGTDPTLLRTARAVDAALTDSRADNRVF